MLLAWDSGCPLLSNRIPGLASVQYRILGAVTAIMLFASVLLHELGHSVVAMRYGIPCDGSRFYLRRHRRNRRQPPSASAEFWIAIAGPAVSLALAILFRWLQPVATPLPAVFALVTYLAYINGEVSVVQPDSRLPA